MADEEPVTSPDQRRPTVSRRLARAGAIFTIVVLVAMMVSGNHSGNIENVFLLGTAGIVLAILIGDWLLRKNGLKSD